MADTRDGTTVPEDDRDPREREYVRGGKGRRDKVGGSGIYPASSPDAPGDAELRTEGELARHEQRPGEKIDAEE